MRSDADENRAVVSPFLRFGRNSNVENWSTGIDHSVQKALGKKAHGCAFKVKVRSALGARRFVEKVVDRRIKQNSQDGVGALSVCVLSSERRAARGEGRGSRSDRGALTPSPATAAALVA